jgi:hypothetical protein
VLFFAIDSASFTVVPVSVVVSENPSEEYYPQNSILHFIFPLSFLYVAQET